MTNAEYGKNTHKASTTSVELKPNPEKGLANDNNQFKFKNKKERSSFPPSHHQYKTKKKEPLKTIPNIEFYKNKVKGMGGIGLSKTELEKIHELVQDEKTNLKYRLELLMLIGEEKNINSLPVVYKLLANKSSQIREEVLHLLYFAFQDRKAIPLILGKLKDTKEHTEVRRKALSMLKLFRAPETIPPILEFLQEFSHKTHSTPIEEVNNQQEIEAALDALAILLTLTENAHSFSLARGKGRKELFNRLTEVCSSQYNVDLTHIEPVLIVS